MQQRSFGEVEGFRRQDKVTRRERFLDEMEQVMPWERLLGRIRPHYPVAGNGRRPYRLETMLRIHLMQQWFGYSDAAMEDALHETPLLRGFAGLDAGVDCMPDESTILHFRHLLEKHHLAKALFGEVTALLAERGFIMREGTIVDATLIAAPPSTKNRDRKRDPEMTSSKKGNDWHFGMKAHIGVDTAHGLVHTVEATTGKVSDYAMSETLLHGDEETVHGDRGYHDKTRTLDAVPQAEAIGPRWYVPFKRAKGQDTTDEEKRVNRILASIRAPVEHPFRVLKCQFGYRKVRYRGLFKNEQQLFTLFALTNIYQARRLLMAGG
ncbi:MAG: IS5 family transposase [Rhodospirillales bacterium]|nr:IS5 family transposase [Rhodospirillales bacterium]